MHYDLWPAPNTGSGNVILPGITALNLEDFLLFGECRVGVVILLRNPINDMDSNMSNLRDLALISLTSKDSKTFYPFLWKIVQAKATEESILKPYVKFITSQTFS